MSIGIGTHQAKYRTWLSFCAGKLLICFRAELICFTNARERSSIVEEREVFLADTPATYVV